MPVNPYYSVADTLTALEARVTAVEAATSRSTFAMSQLDAANRIYQRSTRSGGGQGKGQGAIAVTLNVTAAGPVYARCRSAADGSTIVQPNWTAIANAPVANGPANIVGVDARLGWFYLDLSGDGTTWQNGTVPVGMGRVIAASGQSLAVRMFGKMDSQTTTIAQAGTSVNANSAVYATYSDPQRTVTVPAWATPADTTNYDSAFAAEFLRLQVLVAGVNCGFIGHSQGGQPIGVFVPGGAQNANLRMILDAAGGFETFLWMQGHSDSSAGITGAAYQASLTSLFNDMALHNGVRSSSFDKIISTIPNIVSGWGTPRSIQTIRNAAAVWASSNTGINIEPRDIALIDGVHESQYGAVRLAAHFHRASRAGLGLTIGDAGPQIASVSRANGSPNIALAISLPSNATALVSAGAPATRFKVFVGGTTATPLALDATTPITIDGTTITLKLASVPADGQALDVYFGFSYDPIADGSADMIYSNSNDGDGIAVGRHLSATLSPVQIVVTHVGPNLDVLGAPTYAAAPTGFGQRLTGGTGYGREANIGDALPAVSTFTAEAKFAMAGNPTTLKAMLGAAGRFWFGVATDGRLVANLTVTGANVDYYFNGTQPGGGGTNPIVTDGLEHVVAMSVQNGQPSYLFLDGALIGTVAAPNIPSVASGAKLQVGAFLDAYQWTGTLDEVAIWSSIQKYTAAYTPRATPFVGNEGMTALYHLDGNLSAATY